MLSLGSDTFGILLNHLGEIDRLVLRRIHSMWRNIVLDANLLLKELQDEDQFQWLYKQDLIPFDTNLVRTVLQGNEKLLLKYMVANGFQLYEELYELALQQQYYDKNCVEMLSLLNL